MKILLKKILCSLGLELPVKKIAAKLKLYDFNYLDKNRMFELNTKEKNILENAKLERFSHVAIYGIDEHTENMIAILKYIKKFQNVQYILTEKKDGNPSSFCGLKVITTECLHNVDCIVIANPTYQSAIALRLSYTVPNNILIVNPYKNETVYNSKVLVVNKYLNKNGEAKDECTWNQDRKKMQMQKEEIDAYVEEAMKHVPLFRRIEIETVNRCNGECSFCPVNKKVDPRPLKKMEDTLFKKIVKELHDLDYSEHVAIYSNNEPLIDSRSVEFNEYLREQVPNAKIYMHTNGTLLTKEKFLRLIAVLDELIIDNYNDDLELLPAAKMVKEYCDEHPEVTSKVTIAMRKQHEILTTRGGKAPNRTDMVSYGETRCSLPFRQMVIRPDGKLSLCCNDALGSKTVGDLTKQTMVEAWYGEEYQKMREKIYLGRKNIDICKYCDEFHVIDL